MTAPTAQHVFPFKQAAPASQHDPPQQLDVEGQRFPLEQSCWPGGTQTLPLRQTESGGQQRPPQAVWPRSQQSCPLAQI